MRISLLILGTICLLYSCRIIRQENNPNKDNSDVVDNSKTERPYIIYTPTVDKDSIELQHLKLQRESYSESIQNVTDLISKVESNKSYSVSKDFLPKLKSMKRELEQLQNEVDSLNNLILSGKLIVDSKNIEILKEKEKERKQRADEIIKIYQELKKNETFNLDIDKNIYFETDKYLFADLNYQGKKDLNEFKNKMNKLFDAIKLESGNRQLFLKIRVWGYADGQGDEKYNLNLSIKRANTIYSYLKQNFTGRNYKEIKDIKGFGETGVPEGVNYPRYDNEENWRRRVCAISVRIYTE